MKQTILHDCPALLKDFLFYMETIKGRSGKTVEAYYIDIRMFLRYIKIIRTDINLLKEFDEIKIADVTPDTICSVKLSDAYEFLNFTLETRKNNPNTRSRKVSSIKSFYSYITSKTALLKENPIKDLEVPRIRKTVPKYLSLEQSINLITHVDTKFSERDYCIITLFLNCGMRVSELCGINLSDISYSDKRLK
ncbi:MAG: phage integrase N-terminal SAM-like domain-containing protein, partial [Oscillospiraceae bacterium]